MLGRTDAWTVALWGASLLPVAHMPERGVLAVGLVSQDARRGSGLKAAPHNVEAYHCLGDEEMFVSLLSFEIEILNDTREAAVIPAINDKVSEVRLTHAQQTPGQRDLGIESSYMYADRKAITREQFVRINPGERRVLPLTFRIRFPVAYRVGSIPGVAGPGDYLVAFEWDPWPMGERAAERWRRDFHDVGRLWTEPVRISAMPLSLPAKPTNELCR